SFVLSGAPSGLVNLLARDRTGSLRCWRRGLILGSNGRLNLLANDLIDVIRNESGVLEIVLQCNGRDVRTGSYFVEPTLHDLEFQDWPPAVNDYVQLLRRPLTSNDGFPA